MSLQQYVAEMLNEGKDIVGKMMDISPQPDLTKKPKIKYWGVLTTRKDYKGNTAPDDLTKITKAQFVKSNATDYTSESDYKRYMAQERMIKQYNKRIEFNDWLKKNNNLSWNEQMKKLDSALK